MMTDCWKESPEGRPTFTQIRERLETMMQEGTRYLDPAAANETCAYYNVPSFNSVNEKSANDGTIDIAESDEHDRCKQDDGNDKKQSTVKGNCKDFRHALESTSRFDRIVHIGYDYKGLMVFFRLQLSLTTWES